MNIFLKKRSIVFQISQDSYHLNPLLQFIQNSFTNIKQISDTTIIHGSGDELIKKKYLLQWAYRTFHKELTPLNNITFNKLINSLHLPIYITGINYINTSDINEKVLTNKTFETKLEKSYKVLNITSKSTNKEIKNSYKKMLRKFHPDNVHNTNEKTVDLYTKRFQVIQEAYQLVKKDLEVA